LEEGGVRASSKKSAERKGSPKDQGAGDECRVTDQEAGVTQGKKEGCEGALAEGVGSGGQELVLQGDEMTGAAGMEEGKSKEALKQRTANISDQGNTDVTQEGGEVKSAPVRADPSQGPAKEDGQGRREAVEQRMRPASSLTERVQMEGAGQEVMDDGEEDDDTAEFVLSEGDVKRIVNILEELKNALEKAKHTTVSNALKTFGLILFLVYTIEMY